MKILGPFKGFTCSFRFFIFSLVTLSGCTHSKEVTQAGSPSGDGYHGTKVSWHQGTVEEGLNEAIKSQKLVFLYWGAKWCPPCGHLKETIFSKDEAAVALNSYQRIYLDGDEPHAQSWGEVFQAVGYPTMLIVDGERKELLRLSENISLKDFVSALKAVSEKYASEKGKTSEAPATSVDLDLASSMSWYDAKDWDPNSEEWLLERYKMTDKLLELGRLREASGMAAELLLAARDVAETRACEACEKVRVRAKSVWSAVLRDPEAVFAAKHVLVYSGYDLLRWTFNDDPAQLKTHASTLFSRLSELRESSSGRISPEVWLWTYWPVTQAKLLGKNLSAGAKVEPASYQANLSKDDRAALNQAYSTARAMLKTTYQRNAYEVGLAQFLREIGEWSRAVSDLRAGLESSENKAYVLRALATIEESQGNIDQSEKDWAEAIREIGGKSSKIQWLEGDLQFYLKHRLKGTAATARDGLLRKLERFYEHVFVFEDSFSGRSYRSVKNIEKLLTSTKMGPDSGLAEIGSGYEQRCSRLKMKRDEARCREHFASIKNYFSQKTR